MKTRLRASKVSHVVIHPGDLRNQLAETVQQLQNFRRSLEASGRTYSPRHLQRLAEKLAAIRTQSRRLPKFPKVLVAGSRPAAPTNGRGSVIHAQPTAATPVRANLAGLGQLQALVDATGDLRSASGNLCANAVADAFGVSVNQLAGWLGRSRQAVSKTPDADSLQGGLAAFEEVARLRTALAPDTFRKWLRMPNGQLDGAKPMDMLAIGPQRPIVAGLVADMLTGVPA